MKFKDGPLPERKEWDARETVQPWMGETPRRRPKMPKINVAIAAAFVIGVVGGQALAAGDLCASDIITRLARTTEDQT